MNDVLYTPMERGSLIDGPLAGGGSEPWILRPGLLWPSFSSQARVAYEESKAERHFGLKT